MPTAIPKKIKSAVIAGVFIALFAAPLFSAEEASVEKLVEKFTPSLAIKKDKTEAPDRWYFDGYFEPSNVLQGNRRGHWNEFYYTFGYIHKKIHGYMTVSQQERFDEKDYTAAWGAYLNLDKNQYVHLETGFGWDINFIYQLQNITEYAHRIYDNMFAQVGYTYRAYRGDDTHLLAPGLIYYFGDSYISANYGAGYMESHDTASLGVVKGDFAITDFLRWSLGAAFGSRLYDIYSLDARFEKGYILFTSLNIKIYKGMNFRIGYSYGTEEPKFVKRSISFAASCKF